MSKIIVFGEKMSSSLLSKCLYYGAFNKRFYPKIDQMKLDASKSRIRILTANQVGLEQSVFIMLPAASKMIPSEYRVFFNPKITKISNEMVEGVEESISFPYFEATVNRYKQIFVNYDDKKGKTIEEEMKGLESIWFQQAIDQLMGIPTIGWVASQGRVKLKEKYMLQAQQNPEFLKVFEEYIEEGKKESTQPRDLFHLNLQDDRSDYASQGPTHQPQNSKKYEQLLKQLQNEIFYTF